jgi:hypothetical protein
MITLALMITLTITLHDHRQYHPHLVITLMIIPKVDAQEKMCRLVMEYRNEEQARQYLKLKLYRVNASLP